MQAALERLGPLWEQGKLPESFRQVLQCYHTSSRDDKESGMVDTTWENLGQCETHCTEEFPDQVSTIIWDP